MNDFILAKLKEIDNLQDIKTDELNYKSKCRKIYNFSEYSLPIAICQEIYMKDIYY